jgi:hypothetical protein
MSDRENLSGFDMQEYWDYLSKINENFEKTFGEKAKKDEEEESWLNKDL